MLLFAFICTACWVPETQVEEWFNEGAPKSCWVIAINPVDSYCFEPYEEWPVDFKTHCNSLIDDNGIPYMEFRNTTCDRENYVARCSFSVAVTNEDYQPESMGYYYANFPQQNMEIACEDADGSFIPN